MYIAILIIASIGYFSLLTFVYPSLYQPPPFSENVLLDTSFSHFPPHNCSMEPLTTLLSQLGVFSSIFCMISIRNPHFWHLYSYIGIIFPLSIEIRPGVFINLCVKIYSHMYMRTKRFFLGHNIKFNS